MSLYQSYACVHCSTRPSSSVLHLLGPGAVLLEDRLDALQHNCSFIRNNSWPKKVGNSRIYRGRSSLRIPRDGDTGLVYSSRDRTVYSPQDCADTPPELRLGRLSNDTNENGDSNSPFQSISEQELHNRQEMRYSNGNGHSYFSTPRPLKRSSLNLLTRDTNSNLSLDEISCRMHDRIRRSTPNLANNSPLIRVKHGHRLEGVDGKEFKTRMSKIESWFNEFSDVQRNVVLRKLFPLFTTAQVQLLITTMEPFIDPFCMHNCQVC
ncbi:hypothetical protein LOD99_5003 [Oopsacas minuta]|uniref:Uncharacterized protein n=1 Tax=Oopsacas minuta TaxID=111878 RepID=A0AAV7JTM7_9METZ|nr:hypothetical protein LOD99_5003 [Oopsacas minuta]